MSSFSSLQEKMNNVRVYGEYFMASCLWHGTDEHPSLMVRENGFRCLSCGKHGTLEYLDRYLGGHGVKISTPKPVVLPKWREWENHYGDLQGIADFAHRNSERWYFKERKIDEFFELGYFGTIDNWCLFPVFDSKRKIQNIVVRHMKRKDVRYAIKHIEDNKPLLYVPNWDRVKESDVVYIPFGIVDAWAFEAVGLASATGITGKSLSAELLKTLDRHIVFVPDENEEKEARMLSNKLGWRAIVKRLRYDDDEKDPDQVRRFHGNDYLLKMVTA